MPAKAERYRFHYDERDTPQQRRALRSQRAAQRVRHEFPVGTRVTTRPFGSQEPHESGQVGTIVRHVPGNSAQGGTLTIEWDNGRTGRGISPGGIIPIGGFKS